MKKRRQDKIYDFKTKVHEGLAVRIYTQLEVVMKNSNKRLCASHHQGFPVARTTRNHTSAHTTSTCMWLACAMDTWHHERP